jgi:hypothetical protein
MGTLWAAAKETTLFFFLFVWHYSPYLRLPLLCTEVSVITHTSRHTVGLLWTSDQPVAETSTYTGEHNI